MKIQYRHLLNELVEDGEIKIIHEKNINEYLVGYDYIVVSAR